jgi:putative tryptophan/tyrosine transport system substrate-binding protein
MMDRRRFLLTALAGALAAPRAAGAQQAAKVPRIGWLSIASRTPEASHLIEAFSLGLRELGYVEERNVAIEWRSRMANQSASPRSPLNSSLSRSTS